MSSEFPVSWKIKTIGEVCEKPQYGYTTSASDKKIGPKFVRITDITDDTINWKSVPYCECDENLIEKYLIEKGDLLFARTGTTGVSKLITDVPERAVFASYLIRIKPREGIEPFYLNHFFKSSIYWKQIIQKQVGAIQKGINASVLTSIELPVPPLVEQRGIAEVLSTVDEAIRRTDAVIEKAEELKRGLMQRLLTRGIGHTEFKQTELGETPKTWQLIKFEDVIFEGPQNGIYKHISKYGKGTNILRINDYVDGETIKIKGYKQVELSKDEIYTYKLNQGDIIINRVNSLPYIGKSGIVQDVNEPIVFESNMMRLSLKSNIILSDYAILWLSLPLVKRYFKSKAKRAVAQASINQEDVKNLIVACPPKHEQKRIVDMIYSIKHSILTETKSGDILKRMKQGLMQDLLSGKVQVELRENGLHRIGDS